MKKDKAWLKGLINEEGISMDMHLLGRLDNQYWKNENIKINKGRLFYLIDQLDEPETLSEEWIESHTASADTISYYSEDSVPVVTVSNLKGLLVPNQDKPVIPKFVADYIESQDDPIYGMCIDYEMWGVNGDDVTTTFTGEIAEWFDDTLNVENYYRACIDGYEVEKKKRYYIVDKVNNSTLMTFELSDVVGEEVIEFVDGYSENETIHFNSKEKAELIAHFVGESLEVEEVTE